jgi:hypothetical protein
MKKLFAVGIDLGTSNCALALAGPGSLSVLPIPQCAAPGTLDKADTLPSALFLPLADEFAPDAFSLPWAGPSDIVVGTFARERGPLAPDRHIHSAKSWLCHAQAERKAPILPWNSQAPVAKRSPVEASRLLLEHLRQAAAAAGAPQDAQVVITLPASFDEAARALTLDAAQGAGLRDVVLLEEPQAAFYAWIARNPDTWRKQVRAGDLVLVCDVGGGTADFSLIAVNDDGNGNLALERLSVGEHILLGGDNLDLALAHSLRADLEAAGHSVDAWQFLSLQHAARAAKEKLFSDDSLDEAPVAIAGRGSKLFASTLSTPLTREVLTRIAVDGFLALTGAEDFPLKRKNTALREFGLPYAADPVLSKHLARFLARSREAVASSTAHAALVGPERLAHPSGLLHPSALLFNGGFFKAAPLRQRVEALLASWNGGQAPRTLEGAELDLAVALGAAVFGRQLLGGEGLRIKSSTARAYYLGLEDGGMAIPGLVPPLRAVCVCPLGLEEGASLALPEREFGLRVGEAAEFRFFASTTRGADTAGDIVDDAGRELEETASLELTLPATGDLKPGDIVPVRLETRLSEIGALELRMKHSRSEQSWRLEFNTRAGGE